MAHNRHFAQSQVPGEGVVCPARGAGGGGGTGGRPMKMGEDNGVSAVFYEAVLLMPFGLRLLKKIRLCSTSVDIPSIGYTKLGGALANPPPSPNRRGRREAAGEVRKSHSTDVEHSQR